MYLWPYTLQRDPKYFWTNTKVSVTAAPCSWCWTILNSKDLQSYKSLHKYCKILPSWIAFLSIGDFVLSFLCYLPALSISLNILQLWNSLLPLLPITKTTPESIRFPHSVITPCYCTPISPIYFHFQKTNFNGKGTWLNIWQINQHF